MTFCIETLPPDPRLVASCVYKTTRHLTTSVGARLSRPTLLELSQLLRDLCRIARVPEDGTFFRVDAYPLSDGSISVLEVNAHFVDGWGTALNLSRAVGCPLKSLPDAFPLRWASEEDDYIPELRVVSHELACIGKETEVIRWDRAVRDTHKPFYSYGRVSDSIAHAFPANGRVLDDKQLLAELALLWDNRGFVRIPFTYWSAMAFWDELPSSVVFKSRFKWKGERLPVRFRSDIGRGGDTRRQYEEGEMIAQELVPRYLVDGRPVQLIILCAGTTPTAGYLQHGDEKTRIMNDNSEHGALILETI